MGIGAIKINSLLCFLLDLLCYFLSSHWIVTFSFRNMVSTHYLLFSSMHFSLFKYPLWRVWFGSKGFKLIDSLITKSLQTWKDLEGPHSLCLPLFCSKQPMEASLIIHSSSFAFPYLEFIMICFVQIKEMTPSRFPSPSLPFISA